MNILFISLLDPSESGSGNQKVTLLSAKYLSSIGIHCFIAYFKDSEYSSSQLVFDAKFKIDYNDLEDYEGKELTILAKLESRKYYKDTPLPVFDIYKDFLGLNRALRKQITSTKKQEFESIDIEEDYLGLEFLAIY